LLGGPGTRRLTPFLPKNLKSQTTTPNKQALNNDQLKQYASRTAVKMRLLKALFSEFHLAPAVLAIGLVVLAGESRAETESPYNFIVILVDDQGWGASSVQQDPQRPESKSDFYLTPNLERLAQQSMRFTDAYAPAPNCSPTRASLLTGRSPAALRFTDIANRSSGPHYEGNRLIPPEHVKELSADLRTIPEVLKDHDRRYGTAHFGKWHLVEDPPFSPHSPHPWYEGGGPEDHGFDTGDGNTHNGHGNPWHPGDDPKLAYGVTDRSLKWLEMQIDEERPFYLQISHYAPHLDFQYRQQLLAKFENLEPEERHQNAEFAAMLWDLDVNIGRVLDAYEELGLEDNTYLIYMSDNGMYPIGEPANVNGPLHGYKASLMEGGIRVPLMIRGPGIEPGAVSRAPVAGWDLMPTTTELAGAKVEELSPEIEGGSLKKILMGDGDAEVKRRFEGLFFHWPHYKHGGFGGPTKSVPQTTLRDGDWKLHYWWKTDNVSLYNLAEDPRETRELQDERPGKAKAMRQRIFDYLEEVDAQRPKLNLDFDLERDPAAWRRGDQVEHPQFD